jgi:hypothetical protein
LFTSGDRVSAVLSGRAVGRRRSFLLALSTAVFMVSSGASAQAHRDGCHRWHSCPSDTGSYACGDLGYDSECGGSTGGDVEEILRESDTTAPAKPRVRGILARAGGAVVARVSAERGSTIRVMDESNGVVAKATATGGTQTISFRALDGAHTYRIHAVDAAGNESGASPGVEVTADRTPPSVAGVVFSPGQPTDQATTLTFDTEADSSWTLTPKSKAGERFSGTSAAGSAEGELWLANGRHEFTLSVRDAAGNTSSRDVRVDVAIAAPTFSVERVTRDNQSPTVFRVSGSPRSTGEILIPGQAPHRYSIGESGTSDVSVPLTDGAYAAPRVELVDFQKRRATQTATRFVVDTLAPALDIVPDLTAADAGKLGVTIRTENGARVTTTSPAAEAALPQFTSSGAPRSLSKAQPEGDYDIVVSATDEAGNTTRRAVRVHVADPLTVGEIAIALGLLAIVIALAVLAWRRRLQFAQLLTAVLARIAANVEGRRRRRELAEHERRMSEHAHRFALWDARRAELEKLLDQAEHLEPDSHATPPGLSLRRGEKVYGHFTGSMVEIRHRAGTPYPMDVGRGDVVVTDQRILFEGTKRREWRFDRMTSYAHDEQGRTFIGVSNRQTISGIRHASPAGFTQLLFDIARANHDGSRSAVLRDARRALTTHEADKPQPPPPPGSAPTPSTIGV